MAGVRSISVLMPTWQGAEFLERVLAALAGQQCAIPWDLLVVDSGSTDATLAILERARASFPVPLRVRGIHKLQFDHGDTRNLLAAESGGELLVFLTQDAIPASPRWLATLAANFEDPRVAAAYCRNVPRPDADLLTRLFSEHDPGYTPGRREVRLPPPEAYERLGPHERRLLYNFNDVASAVRRAVWELHPFPRTEFGEDLLMARALLEGGHTVVYDDVATVEHSHDYAPAEMRARAAIDGKFNIEWLERVCVGSVADAHELTRRQLVRDEEALRAAGVAGAALAGELQRARALREAAFLGLHEGGLSERRFAGSAMLRAKHLHILYVVHGFPPDTWAGTEVYTLELAREMQRLGHRVTILTRAPCQRSEADGGPAEFALQQGQFQGLEVWRMTHRIDHKLLRHSYRHPAAEQVFRDVLARVRPDVVHFQHLLHFSALLPQIAREQGLPSVITCNDYWGLCARVQLIRPDGVRCEQNQGMGCLLCVKHKDNRWIPAAKRHLGKGWPLLRTAAALARRPLPSVKLERRLGPRLQPWRQRVGRIEEGWRDMAQRQAVTEGGYAATDLQIAPSRFLRAKYLATGRFEPRRFVYSPYGMRCDHLHARAKRPDPQGRLRVGFIGSLVWFKGAAVLVRAMARLQGTRAVLHVHGAFKPESDAHHKELEQLARGSEVVFHGAFDNARLAEIHAELDVLVVPSVWFENSPLAIHEAFLLHTPVVVSDIGGMAELVEDGVHGLHFKVGDDEDLARVLRRFLDEPDLIARLSRQWPQVKSVAEDAREMEFRYRGLACILRAGSGGPGSDAMLRAGQASAAPLAAPAP